MNEQELLVITWFTACTALGLGVGQLIYGFIPQKYVKAFQKIPIIKKLRQKIGIEQG